MRINLKYLREHGYDIHVENNFVDINPRDFKPCVQMLISEFSIEEMYAYQIENDIHEFQVLTEIRRSQLADLVASRKTGE